MTNGRLDAVEIACRKEPLVVEPPSKATSDYFGCKVFNRSAMRKYLSSDTRRMVYESIEQGVTLDKSVAEYVAAGMKQWAMEMGATHYTHWFQPLTGGTAEKHDSFAEPYGHDGSLESFSGKLLCQQEPDASSFPNGGLRNTFEARGYTAWDPSSPAFILDDCLCIPTVFISYNGEALDYKTPLLKSISAVSKATKDVLSYFGLGDEMVQSYLGWEQEYFLVDRDLFSMRQDLMMTGRTLQGHNSSKNQQLDDHYFGAIPSRVFEFMKELEFEAYKLGIPVKTRHNEVAPNQFEIAPVYEEANLAVDHNLLLMSLMKDVAEKHGFEVLLHEKPYDGVNGSGKHCNWSLGTLSGIGLLSPGKTTEENLRFLVFMSNILKAVYDNNALLKASIMTASNAHRLGANEAPPAIISSFLGKTVSEAFTELLNSKDMVKIKGKKIYSLGIPQIPELLVDNTDRNRTSPFAFTGNRFEFRAVGSSANCSAPITVLNTIVASQLIKFKKNVDKRIEKGEDTMTAILNETRETYKACQKICFDGNGYSEEWKKEAEKRKLDCESSAPITFDAFTSKRSIDVFKESNVLTEVELKARNEVFWETYSKKIEIEARTLRDMALNHLLPVAVSYKSNLLDIIWKAKEVYGDDYKKYIEYESSQVAEISKKVCNVYECCGRIDTECDRLMKIGSREQAVEFHDKVIPIMEKIRAELDTLEMIIDDQMWPMPKYRELLFIS
ncbi:MAG: glutamine synthetase III [Methanomassiliicoccales archaeon]|uniref:glutamine synthetase III family protein n=1 Tax=Candidatus Methanarcanum hacksteinii TaxID=2911857 RepID=UPI0015AA6BEB|nr:glutamine synthetase III [Candidatus Methanomethylophilaceae archaeon]MCI6024529.1 glutamine synthetase III [Methanomassiliicoccales archaeon]MDD7479285.1 glutamine synthetase III [Methanomassiliicoccales archaeon]MDO5837441.1 glutamine synthetase III [Methanomassiliicoccales archaeon]MDY4580544.1 glutamine synthetase III [Candidatus Methanarcanum hacksteinii]